MDALERIGAALAAPKTHRVIAKYACGKVYTFDTRSQSSAQSHAEFWLRKIGRELIDRDTGSIVRVVSVEIERIA